MQETFFIFKCFDFFFLITPDYSLQNSPGPSELIESQSRQLEDPQLLPGTSQMSDAVCTDEGSDAEC